MTAPRPAERRNAATSMHIAQSADPLNPVFAEFVPRAEKVVQADVAREEELRGEVAALLGLVAGAALAEHYHQPPRSLHDFVVKFVFCAPQKPAETKKARSKGPLVGQKNDLQSVIEKAGEGGRTLDIHVGNGNGQPVQPPTNTQVTDSPHAVPSTYSANGGHSDISDPVLAHLILLWPTLPKSVRATIIAVIDSADKREG